MKRGIISKRHKSTERNCVWYGGSCVAVSSKIEKIHLAGMVLKTESKQVNITPRST